MNTRSLAILLLLGPAAGAAQSPVLVQGIIDAEAWYTDANSNLLSRNQGRPAYLARATVWGAVEPRRGLVLYGLLEGGSESGAKGDAQVEQLAVRYTVSPRFVLDVGKITGLVGTFTGRRFSSRNPLIGTPDGYVVQYPWGAQVSGATNLVDYRAGMLSMPEYHEEYTPEPTPILRPAAGLGITPLVGFRLGASWTQGPYLNDQLSASQVAQKNWRYYQQRILAADLAISVGYLELRAEAGTNSYDVPGRAGPIEGLQYYAEGKYTLTPRLFIATRFQRNDYPFIRPVSQTTWVARKTDFHDEEFGLGYRLARTTLVKAAYHQDTWHVTPSNAAFIRPGGKAFVVQVSQGFDVMALASRP